MAKLDSIPPDPGLARGFVEQAKVFLRDATDRRNDARSRALLAHQAAVSACDGALAFSGLRVTGDEGGHRLRLEEAASLLDLEEDTLLALQGSRAERNNVSYAAGMVSLEDVADSVDAARDLVDAASALVEG